MFKKTLFATGLALSSAASLAQTAEYEVSITNITPGQTFTCAWINTN